MQFPSPAITEIGVDISKRRQARQAVKPKRKGVKCGCGLYTLSDDGICKICRLNERVVDISDIRRMYA